MPLRGKVAALHIGQHRLVVVAAPLGNVLLIAPPSPRLGGRGQIDLGVGTAQHELPSWRFLGVMGLIAGGPTFLGTLVGQSVVNETLNMAFLALAAGSILYVVVQLLNVGFKLGHKEMLMWGLFAGIVLGFGTDLVLVAAGA